MYKDWFYFQFKIDGLFFKLNFEAFLFVNQCIFECLLTSIINTTGQGAIVADININIYLQWYILLATIEWFLR